MFTLSGNKLLPTSEIFTKAFTGMQAGWQSGLKVGGIMITSAHEALPTKGEIKDHATGVINEVCGNVEELLALIQNPQPTLEGKVIQLGTLAWNIVHTGEKVTAILVATQVRFFHNLTGGFTTDLKIAQVSIKVGDALLRPEENFIPRVLQITDAANSTVELAEYLANLR